MNAVVQLKQQIEPGIIAKLVTTGDLSRFWKKVEVNENGCWPWKAYRNAGGYGAFRIRGRTFAAHRLALFGGRPPKRIVVMHACDNPSCCNPSHLRAGTQADNVADCISKGRRRNYEAGERHHKARLTASQVIEIRTAFANLPRLSDGRVPAGTASSLAARYEITYENLIAIVRRRTWRHI